MYILLRFNVLYGIISQTQSIILIGEINMRCKNCGTENDDNRYICEICGSPLYDEEDIQTPLKEETHTQTFSAVSSPMPKSETDDNAYLQPPLKNNNNKGNGEKTPAEKKSIIVIAILAVVLIAIIASIIVVAQSRSKDSGETTSEISTTQSTTERTTEWTTQPTTEKTTAFTTAATTTTTTTTAITWYINAGSSGGGTVSGEGEYKNGDKVTLTAVADSGYVFDGWYSSGVKVSSSVKYTFTANENASFSAVFNPVETQDNSIEEGEINFGD